MLIFVNRKKCVFCHFCQVIHNIPRKLQPIFTYYRFISGVILLRYFEICSNLSLVFPRYYRPFLPDISRFIGTCLPIFTDLSVNFYRILTDLPVTPFYPFSSNSLYSPFCLFIIAFIAF